MCILAVNLKLRQVSRQILQVYVAATMAALIISKLLLNHIPLARRQVLPFFDDYENDESFLRHQNVHLLTSSSYKCRLVGSFVLEVGIIL